MKFAKFCEKYNISTANIHIRRKNGTIPAWVFYTPTNSTLHIREDYFLSRGKFQEKVIQYNRDVYWYANEHFKDSYIARQVTARYGGSCSSMKMFLGSYLFRDNPRPLTVLVSKRHWTFFKWGRKLLRDLDMTIEDVRDELAKG